MNRKFKFYLAILLLIAVILGLLWIADRPQSAPVVQRNLKYSSIAPDELNQKIYDSGDAICIFFYRQNDANSTYVQNQILLPIAEQYDISGFDALYFVDVTDVSDDQIGNNWSVYHVPAFAVISIANSTVNTTDVLSYDPSEPFTQHDVENWLDEHKLIPQEK